MRASIFVILVSVLVQPAAYIDAVQPDQPNQQGQELWQLAVRAKGGEQKLDQVRNFAFASGSRFSESPRPDVASHVYQEALCELPSRCWMFIDYRPGKMGVRAELVDLDKHAAWISVDKQPATAASQLFDGFAMRMRRWQYVYFMQTKWLKPVPVRSRSVSAIGKTADVIEAMADQDRIDFFLDPRSHLPFKISITTPLKSLRSPGVMQDYTITMLLRDYLEVDGIQMPSRVDFADTKNKTSYEINVSFDQAIFDPAKLSSAKPQAWKPNGRSSDGQRM